MIGDSFPVSPSYPEPNIKLVSLGYFEKQMELFLLRIECLEKRVEYLENDKTDKKGRKILS